MGVTLMQPDRRPRAGNQLTPEEALASYSTYTSYFGTFTVNEAEGFVTHHLEGSLNTGGAGSDNKRFYTLSGNRLTLQPPAAENGNKTHITWEKLPDLPESELTETHRRLFGFYRIESVSRRIVDGESVPANPYETAFVIYAPSGHMAVHLMRPGREPYAGTRPTPEEALAAVQTYGGYFGPFSVHEDEGYLVHHRIGALNPGGDWGRCPTLLRADRHASHPATARRDRQRGPSGAKHAEVDPDRLTDPPHRQGCTSMLEPVLNHAWTHSIPGLPFSPDNARRSERRPDCSCPRGRRTRRAWRRTS